MLIDDIQLLRYDEEARLQFFHTFNALHNKGKQIVITSNVPPQRLDGFEYRLRCRFEWGVIAEIKEPNTDDREKRRRTEAGMLDGPHTSLGERKSGPDVGLRNIEENESTTSVSPELVIGETAKYYEISEDDILGTERSRTAIKARQIAMYLSRELTDLKLWEIGRVFGGRDHTTPMHAIKKITGARAVEESVRHEIEDLIKIIKDANRNRSRDNG